MRIEQHDIPIRELQGDTTTLDLSKSAAVSDLDLMVIAGAVVMSMASVAATTGLINVVTSCVRTVTTPSYRRNPPASPRSVTLL